jgi:hypothetical protein
MKPLFRLPALLALAVALAACGAIPPPRAMNVSEICKQPSGTMVSSEGYLRPPMGSTLCTSGQCRLNFYDNNGAVAVMYSTLPVQLPDGTRANRNTRVKLTGPVRTAPKLCYLEVYWTERG